MDTQDFFIYETGANGAVIVDDHLTTLPAPHNRGYSHHDYFEMYLFLDGDLSFSAEGAVIDIIPGDMILLSPHIMHRILINKACRYHRKHIFFQDSIFLLPYSGALWLRDQLAKQSILKISSPVVREQKLDQLFSEIVRAICNHTPYDDFCALISLMQLLIRCESCHDHGDVPAPQIRDQRAHDILRYIDTHIAEPLDYQTIARQFYVSEKNLYQIFKKETGLSPARYINERRIIKAKLLLHQGYSAAEAAELTGYQDYSVFYRNFRKGTGISPADYLKGVMPEIHNE